MKRVFWFGALGYPVLELIYRGRTHYSMMVAGGLSAILIEQIRRRRHIRSLYKPILCSAGITAIEYFCGLIWNQQYRVWDYRQQPLNFRGQICMRFSALWCFLSAGIMGLMNFYDKAMGPD